MESTMSLPKPPSLPPDETLSPSVTPPMLYVYEDTVWEYKLLVRARDQDELPSEEEMRAGRSPAPRRLRSGPTLRLPVAVGPGDA